MDQIGPLDQLTDNCYTSGPKLALEHACGPAVTLQDAGVSAGGLIATLEIQKNTAELDQAQARV